MFSVTRHLSHLHRRDLSSPQLQHLLSLATKTSSVFVLVWGNFILLVPDLKVLTIG